MWGGSLFSKLDPAFQFDCTVSRTICENQAVWVATVATRVFPHGTARVGGSARWHQHSRINLFLKSFVYEKARQDAQQDCLRGGHSRISPPRSAQHGRRYALLMIGHKTPTVKAWLEKHPRFHMHFTPAYSSWINQVERFFGFVTEDLLRRSDHRSVQAFEADTRAWVKTWNEHPTPFTWTKTAEQILESLGRLLHRISGAGH